MNENYIRILVSVVGALLVGATTYVSTSLIRLDRNQSVIQNIQATRNEELRTRMIVYDDTIGRLDKRLDLITDKMLELHPMQASSLAWYLSHNSQAACRDDFDCPEGQICFDEVCEDL